MVNLPLFLLRHRVTVEPYLGDGAYGPTFGDPAVDVPALVGESVRMVRTADREVTSTAQVIATAELHCPVGSRITLPDGRTATALVVSRHTAPGLPVPACTEVMCG
ncbi:hypothetical protein ACFYVL_27820 [Streptomyces sp. NPDC004111]|uniref:hypothetical protein n=1 Tax=Streptomyces sp. NPDC004111 TaxID=3364690 RepID=UPI00367D50CD